MAQHGHLVSKSKSLFSVPHGSSLLPSKEQPVGEQCFLLCSIQPLWQAWSSLLWHYPPQAAAAHSEMTCLSYSRTCEGQADPCSPRGHGAGNGWLWPGLAPEKLAAPPHLLSTTHSSNSQSVFSRSFPKHQLLYSLLYLALILVAARVCSCWLCLFFRSFVSAVCVAGTAGGCTDASVPVPS